MIIGKGPSCGLEKERIHKRHAATANKEMECPADFYLAGEWLGANDIGMGELPAQQTQEPTANQSDIYATGNANLGSISSVTSISTAPTIPPRKVQANISISYLASPNE